MWGCGGAGLEARWGGVGWGGLSAGGVWGLMLRPVVMCLAETQSDGPPGKSIPGILPEQQAELGPGTPAGLNSKHTAGTVFFSTTYQKTSPCASVMDI